VARVGLEICSTATEDEFSEAAATTEKSPKRAHIIEGGRASAARWRKKSGKT
jgi:hypothetical protein